MFFFNQMFDSTEEKHIMQSSQSKYQKSKHFLVVDKQVMRFQQTHKKKPLKDENYNHKTIYRNQFVPLSSMLPVIYMHIGGQCNVRMQSNGCTVSGWLQSAVQ